MQEALIGFREKLSRLELSQRQIPTTDKALRIAEYKGLIKGLLVAIEILESGKYMGLGLLENL